MALMVRTVHVWVGRSKFRSDLQNRLANILVAKEFTSESLCLISLICGTTVEDNILTGFLMQLVSDTKTCPATAITSASLQPG